MSISPNICSKQFPNYILGCSARHSSLQDSLELTDCRGGRDGAVLHWPARSEPGEEQDSVQSSVQWTVQWADPPAGAQVVVSTGCLQE